MRVFLYFPSSQFHVVAQILSAVTIFKLSKILMILCVCVCVFMCAQPNLLTARNDPAWKNAPNILSYVELFLNLILIH